MKGKAPEHVFLTTRQPHPGTPKIMIIITDYDIIYNEEDNIFPKEQ
jgi:hypothetical protein